MQDGARELHALDRALDFDNHDPSLADDWEWWRMQDAEMTRDELDALEVAAEIQELRTQGYM